MEGIENVQQQKLSNPQHINFKERIESPASSNPIINMYRKDEKNVSFLELCEIIIHSILH